MAEAMEKPGIVNFGESMSNNSNEASKQNSAGFRDYLRIFTFSERFDWILNTFALIAAIGSGTALALLELVFGGFVTVLYNFMQGGDTATFQSQVNKYSLYFVYLGIARFCFTYTFTMCTAVSSTRITRTIRYRYLQSILSQNIAFFDEGSYGSVSSQVVTNGNMIQQGIAEKLGLTVQALATFVAAFVVAFVSQWKLTLITLGIVPAILLATGITASIDAIYESNMLDIYGRAGSFAEDVISSMRTVHAFWAGPKLVQKYDDFLETAHRIGKKKSPVYMILFSVEFFCIYAGFALAFWQGLRMYNSGEIQTPGVIVAVLFSVVIAATSLTTISPNIIVYTSAVSAAATLFKSIDRESEINPFNQQGLQPLNLAGDINLQHINFTYPTRPNVQVLNDFTLTVPAGKVTALVGASGSGKSTIIGLFERWYNATSGSITIDGHPIQDLNVKWLRTHVRLVQQEPVLFMGTVFQNVVFGLIGTEWENAPAEKQRELVMNACKLANAHDFVSALPQGYDTECGERAGLLSGGQKQRIAIARSVISEPSILLLDEATSALDPHAEGIVQAALDEASKNRTTIVIAHKLATIKNADNIVVMSKGRIVEQGTHSSLLEADGAYAKLVKVQDLGSAVDSEKDEDDTEPSAQDSSEMEKPVTKLPSQQIKRLCDEKDRDNYEMHKPIGMIRIVWTLLKEQSNLRLIYFLTTCMCVVGGAVYPAQALLFSHVMEVFNYDTERRIERGNFFSLMFFVVALAILFVYGVLGWTTNLVVQEMSHTYRREQFQYVLKQDMQFFDRSENTAGAVTSRLSSFPQSITELMGFNLALIFICIINLLASCTLAIVYSWKLGLVVVFAGIPPLVGAGWARIRLDLKMQNDNANRYASTAALAGEAVSAIRTVSSLALEPTILARFSDCLKDVVQSTIRQTMYIMIFFSLTQTIEFFFMALGFWWGCRLIAQGEISTQAFYIAFVGVFFSGEAASQFFSYSTSITKAKGAANYIFWLRSLQPKIAETPINQNQGPPPDGNGEMALDNLRFSYPLRPTAQVLRGVSLNIKPGQFVALVGASGCGKSTLVAMLERFYDPISGRIELSDADVSQMSPRLYRSLIGLVQQEPTLYQDSIRENIALGLSGSSSDEISDDQIMDACKQANAWEFVSSLPEGLGTFCGSRGLSLSGGQRQRIAIARALIRNPKILLLDEATSALDTESERVVQAALSEAAASGDRITVAVAHRLSTIKEADLICVFLGGKIVEAGKHQDLLEEGGLYAKMCQAQSLDKAV